MTSAFISKSYCITSKGDKHCGNSQRMTIIALVAAVDSELLELAFALFANDTCSTNNMIEKM